MEIVDECYKLYIFVVNANVSNEGLVDLCVQRANSI